MGQHYLRMLFSPKSVAVIGASDRAHTVGEVVFRNMLESGYKGLLYAVNPAHQKVQGQRRPGVARRRAAASADVSRSRAPAPATPGQN